MMKRGSARIDAILGKFETVKRELEQGIDECSGQESMNNQKIADLKAKNAVLVKSKETATKVLQNIRKMMEE